MKTVLNDYSIKEVLSPQTVTIPYENIEDVLVKVSDKVFKNQMIVNNKSYSPVSGIVSEIDSKFIIITNDYREHTGKKSTSKKSIYDIDKENIINLVNKYTYITIKDNYKYLIVSLVDKEKFVLTTKYLISNYIMTILETVDCLALKLNIDKIYIAVKNKDEEIITTVNNNIGTYPNINIKRVNEIYGIGYKEVLIPSIIKEEVNDDYLYLDCVDILSINNAIKNEKPTIENYLTLINNSTNEAFVINTKIGTKLGELRSLFDISDEDILVNGLIGGVNKSDEDIVDINTRSVFFANPLILEEQKCINCGLCTKLCPMHLNPKYIKTHKKVDTSRCIGCGTCTFICPSKINFKPYLGDRDE